MAQLVMGAVGAVAGFFIGGPTGAMIGFNIGASLGASMEDVSVQGNKLGDIAAQTSKEGVARPIVWGRVRPIGGNLIATSAPDIVKTKHKSGGKGGGGSTTTTTESVYRTYAIRVCEGPITGFVRIWRNNELVYDARGNAWGDENNPAFLGVATLYTGAWDQMPDPSLEGVFGSGNVPPHRGTAYMVMNHELLDDTGGAVPQWIFEVERAEGQISTSRVYPVENFESSKSDGIIDAWEPPRYAQTQSSLSSGLYASSISMLELLNKTDQLESSSSSGIDISVASLVYNATSIDVYSMSDNSLGAGLSISSASMDDVLITYHNDDGCSSSGVSIFGWSMV